MAPPEHPGLTDLQEIGRGGFGVVYRARQERLHRDVAVKLLSARPDEQVLVRFAQECRALGQLSGHPHIVEVHDGGVREDGQAFLVMPYYDNGSLAARLKRSGPMRWPDVADVGVRLAGALQTAHDAGILHRDLKPANILLDDYEGPRLADFGQARLGDADLTRTGEAAITPGFAAPEVLNGERATAQSDIYALGATLVALLIGRPPFETGGDLVALFYRVVNEPPPDVRPLGVPDRLAAALERALRKDPAARYASAEQFGQDLRAAQRELGIAPSPLVVGRRPAAALPPVESVRTDPAVPGPASWPVLGTAPPTIGPSYAGSPPMPARYVAGPPRSPYAGPAAPPPVRRQGWLAPAAILLTCLALAAGAFLVVREVRSTGDGGGQATGASATTAAASTTPSTGVVATTTATTQTSPSTPPPTVVPVGQADVSAVAADPDAAAVGETLSAYFNGVNDRDFDSYAVFSPELRGRIGYEQWADGLATTADSAVAVVGIERPGDGTLLAQTTFTSEQAPDQGPAPGETCTNWTLTYLLVPSVDGPTPYQIDDVDDVGPGHTAC